MTGNVLDAGQSYLNDLVWTLEEFGDWDVNLDGVIGVNLNANYVDLSGRHNNLQLGWS